MGSRSLAPSRGEGGLVDQRRMANGGGVEHRRRERGEGGLDAGAREPGVDGPSIEKLEVDEL